MFSIEFAQSKVLQWSLGALVFVYFIVFYSWNTDATVSARMLESMRYVCPPYFQSCELFYFLDTLPDGYSQTILYMAFFGLLAWCAYFISEKAWRFAQLTLIPPFMWHAANVLLFTDNRSGNYEYYLISFGLILLFFPHKEFFLKFTIVFFYILSTAAKIHPSWIEGTYFTTLRTGLPLFPNWSIPLVTNVVILAEMIGSWFLLSQNKKFQRTAFIFFVLFHLYSGILVGYRYPATVLTFVLILFGPWYRYTPVPLDKKAFVGWVFILLIVCFQLSPKLIYGDEKLTMEGNKYGLYMFDANHQCFSEAKIHSYDGSIRVRSNRSIIARDRCQPYEYWFPLKKMCEQDESIKQIEWQFTHSINGGPFYKIVDIQNACNLIYAPMRHNEWIKTEKDAEIMGYPVKNIYY